jgi:putative cardiolipin synthase
MPTEPAVRARGPATHSRVKPAALGSVLLLVTACASLPPEPAPRGDALPRSVTETSALAGLARTAAAAHRNDCGIRVLDSGREAFLERAALIEAAQRSIDAQYYIWNSDATGRYLAARLLSAAERGVRVRVLLDDINVAGRDSALALIDRHPNVEIRIYNPAAERKGLRKVLGFLREFTRLNRRMHNKSFTVDGSVTILGGRNIGDEYFDAGEHLNFRDRDVTVIGAVVADASAMFDDFWNSALARPVGELVPNGAAPHAAAARGPDGPERQRLDALFGALPQGDAAGVALFGRSVAAMQWAPARLVHDVPPDPEEVGNTSVSQACARTLGAVAGEARNEILVESAYLVLDRETVDAMRAMHARGLRVRALTNSLASNDVTANHAAYARRRDAMLAGGMELYELRPDAASCRTLVMNPAACGPGHVFGLHAKTFVFDRRTVYVGSLNLNLRSRFLNAESGLVIDSPAIAERIAADIELNMEPRNSWHVVADASGRAQWLQQDGEGGAVTTVHHDPEVSWARRMRAALIAALPLEKYL